MAASYSTQFCEREGGHRQKKISLGPRLTPMPPQNVEMADLVEVISASVQRFLELTMTEREHLDTLGDRKTSHVQSDPPP